MVEMKTKDPSSQSSTNATAILQAVFFTAWIFVVVLKSISGDWDILSIPKFPTSIEDYLDTSATLQVLGWFVLQCVLYLLPIGGQLVEGPPAKDTGVKLKYRLNAFFVLMVNVFGFLILLLSGIRVTGVSENMLQYATSGVILTFISSLLLYVKGRNLSKTDTGFNNWFNGLELNPRIGPLDLKYVIFRSVIIGWVIFNFINLVMSFENGQRPSLSLLVVVAFQLLYVADYFWFEDGVLVTRDITHEHLGYNRLIQFLMIPFIFVVQTRYLLLTKFSLQWYLVVLVTSLNALGYWIYRRSNSEKNNFRRNPNDPEFKDYEVIPTATGRNLLVSGWWGLSRHPNYFGDILIALSYSLQTGFNHLLPYLNTIFLVMMLVDREKQDGAECSRRYGDSWEKYCHRVKYRIVPYLY